MVPVAEYMEKLKSRKAEVGEQIDRSRAANRYEAPPPATAETIQIVDEPLLNPGFSRPNVSNAPNPPTATSGLAPEGKTQAPESYTNRLLKAKLKVWEDREKEKGNS